MSGEARSIIRGLEVVVDDWRYVDEDPAGLHRALIFPLARWQADRDHWWLWAGRLGVRIGPADSIETLIPDLARVGLIAIEFPGSGEGRGYTQARLLRDRHGFTGEIRAVGHVKQDQLFFLSRCGFDAFEPAAGADVQAALQAFGTFDVAYQALPERRYAAPALRAPVW